MNEPSVMFSNEEFGWLRTAVIRGTPFFALPDVCRALDLRDPSKVAARLRGDDKEAASDTDTRDIGGVISSPLPRGIIPIVALTGTGLRPVNFISERNLHNLILVSRKPAARRFKRWVVSEVLPAIRSSYVFATPSAYLQALKAQYLEVGKLIELERQRAQLTGGQH